MGKVSNASLRRTKGQKIVLRSDSESYKEKKVAIISGGGSGHEPLHVGFVGCGMLVATLTERSNGFTQP
jgi:triose/dihydroxyacetone kinase / FAD-AMP lyase (cyclizing)